MENNGLAVVVLAAGKGTRMRSNLAKVLHPLGGRPMIQWVVEKVLSLCPGRGIVVVGHQASEVKSCLSIYPLSFAQQDEQLGTGHALRCALPLIPETCSQVMVLCGDTPLIREKTLRTLFECQLQARSALTLLVTRLENPKGYGRVLCTPDGSVHAIAEEKDATPEEKQVKLINTGFYCFERSFLEQKIMDIQPDNAQGEYYLTDLVGAAVRAGMRVECIHADCPEEVMGINTPENLKEAEEFLGLIPAPMQFP